MTRYSASRGIMYTAPPESASATEEAAEAEAEPTPADD